MLCFIVFRSHIASRSLRAACLALALAALPFIAKAQESPSAAEAPRFQSSDGSSLVDALPLKSTDARVTIAGPLAEVELTQIYANIGDTPLEALYVFPGSTSSAVSGLEMRVGDRITRAQIKRKEEARAIYSAARSEGKTASLLEQRRPNVFQMNLANILPGDVVEVTLRYSEWLTQEDGAYRFVLPTVVGPRYGEASGSEFSDPGSGAPAPEFAIDVHIAAGVAIEWISSPTHRIEVEQPDAARADLRCVEDPTTIGSRDFALEYRVAGDAVKSGLLLSRSNGERFFMAVLQPPRPGAPRPRIPREYFFVIDVSGSMRGFPLDIAKRSMSELVVQLDPADRFNLLLFAGSSSVFASESVAATDENLAAALEFLDTADGVGSTELLPALEMVYRTAKNPACSRSIVVITDGFINVEAEAFDMVRARLDEANVFAIGVGSAVNRFLIEGLARVGMGEPMFALGPDDAELVAHQFAEYVSQPVLSSVALEFDGIDAYDVEPARLPDLLAQRPIVVFGKWRSAREGAAIRISGHAGDSEYANAVTVASGTDLGESRTLEHVWARERIQQLADYSRLWPDDARAQEVTRLGLKHSLMTAYTSFVAVDEVRRRPSTDGLARAVQPLPLPAGMEANAAGGPLLTVPITPEPELWGLMLCFSAACAWVAQRRRKALRGQP